MVAILPHSAGLMGVRARRAKPDCYRLPVDISGLGLWMYCVFQSLGAINLGPFGSNNETRSPKILIASLLLGCLHLSVTSADASQKHRFWIASGLPTTRAESSRVRCALPSFK